jgi:hypothetical protein
LFPNFSPRCIKLRFFLGKSRRATLEHFVQLAKHNTHLDPSGSSFMFQCQLAASLLPEMDTLYIWFKDQGGDNVRLCLQETTLHGFSPSHLQGFC